MCFAEPFENERSNFTSIAQNLCYYLFLISYIAQSFRSPLDDNVPFIAAFAGISLFTAAFGVSLLVNDGGNTMMKSLMSPFGFGRTSPSSSDVANRIPNIGNVVKHTCH